MRFIHTADIHLGAVPDQGQNWSQLRAREIWNTFRALIEVTRRDKIDLLLIAGDLFHRSPTMRELKEVRYLFESIPSTQIVLIAGNHDYIKPQSAWHHMQWPKHVHFLADNACESIHFPQIGTTVYGLSYHQQEIRHALYDDLCPDSTDGCHILLAHGGDASHIPFHKQVLLDNGFDYIALGHIHKPQVLAANRMAYAGALEPIDINDTGEHGYILGSYEKKRIFTSFVPFACREYIHVELTSDASCTDTMIAEQISDAITEYGQDNIYRFFLRGTRDADIVFDTGRYLALGNIVSITDETHPDYDLESLLHHHEHDLLGRFYRCLARADVSEEIREQALSYGIQALLGGEL